MSDLYRLVYASKNLLALSEAEARAAVSQILATSQANNVRCDVTGALMFNGGAFAQVLEGPRHGVEETFERIQRDARHGDVTVLECGPVPSRGFPNWSMAFVGDSAEGRALWDGLAGRSGFEMSRLDGDAVFRMLHALVRDEEDVTSAPEPRILAIAGFAPSTQDSDADMGGFDASRVRAEMARLRPEPAAPPRAAPDETAGRHDLPVEDAAVTILRASLARERQRTTDLRSEIDDLRTALLRERARNDADLRDRDLWAERARCLAATLCQEADAVRRGGEASVQSRAA